ncbi:MAG: hypothetical protein JRI22_13980 [Deltaproteobacteria bacterium]|nr:hypothetical protein [Deltaproteobacteria bacterium]
MNAYELITEFRDAVGEDVAVDKENSHTGRFKYPAILRWLNRSQMEVQRLLVSLDDRYFLTAAAQDGLANQNHYSLPPNCLMQRVLMVERVEGGSRYAYWPIDLEEKEACRRSSAAGLAYHGRFEIRESGVILYPPPPAGNDNVVIYHNRRLADLDFGPVPSDAGNTDLTLNSTARPVADYYDNYRVTIVGPGNAADQTRTITDYTAGRVCTVAQWDTSPTTEDYYAIECELGEDFERLMMVKAVMMAMRRDSRAELSLFRQEHNELMASMISSLHSRDRGPAYVHWTQESN